MKAIGPSFVSEITQAGLAGLPFSWAADGSLWFSPEMTQVQIDAVQAVYAAHNPGSVPVIVPLSVTRFQARAALLEAGLLDMVDGYFAALPAEDLTRLAWEEAPTVERNSDATTGAAQSLGLSSDQIDQLFIKAGTF